MSTVASTVQEWSLIIQIIFVIGGLVLAFAGRYIHDAFILLIGWLIGATTGFWVSSAITTGVNLTGFSQLAVIGVSTLLLGAFGARWLWGWYVFTISFTGMVLSYFIFTIGLRLEPYSTALEGAGAIFTTLLSAAVFFLGVVPGLLGLLAIVISVPLIINHKGLIRHWQNLSIIKEEITEGGTSISVRIVAVIGFIAGILLIGAMIAIWLWPYTRNLFSSYIDTFVFLLGSPALVSMIIVLAAIIMGGITWILHNKILIIETAAFGAVLVTVAGTVDQFFIALLDQQFTIVTEMIRSSALLFVVIFLAGLSVQGSADYLLLPDSEE